ncbi:hypothetical protein LTR10_010790 [Elasticomyces elasticus]|nr:hypothetical protein LTR10_010790 [Elasticomyces elasticus]KAK4968396.1 hypothetical protein LTR42_009679 [Elasticomyces elasticus]
MAQTGRPLLGHRRQPSRVRPREDGVPEGVRGLQNDATVTFIKRVLCTKTVVPGPGETTAHEVNGRLEDLLPPLTSRRDLDVQLYALLAIILSQFVQSWYNRITPDNEFIEEVVRIIAHCIRGLEQRLKLCDLESLLLDELPALLSDHLDAIGVAADANRSQPGAGVAFIFQVLRPHNALSPLPIDDASAHAQRNNELAWSQLLVQSVVPLLLPSEDLENPCLNVVVTEIFSEMILRNAIVGKTSQPWLLWEGVTKLIYVLKPKAPLVEEAPPLRPSKLEQFGLLSNEESIHNRRNGPNRSIADISLSAFLTFMQYCMLIWTVGRALLVALFHASDVPQRNRGRQQKKNELNSNDVDRSNVARPIVGMRMWSCVGRLTSLGERMPWLIGCLSLSQWLSISTGACSTDSIIDR